MLGDAANAESTANTKMLYAGEQFDSSASMYYNRARYYNPSNGTFNRVDPFSGNNQDPQSLHKYAYCHNNPVMGIDPSGLFTIVSVLSSTAIQNILRRYVQFTKVMNTYHKAQNTINLFQTVVSLATFLTEVMTSIGSGGFTPAVLASALKSAFGQMDISPSDFTGAFNQMFNVIGKHWDEMEEAMIKEIPNIAQQMAAGLAARAAIYTAKINAGKDVDLVIGLPTPPFKKLMSAKYLSIGKNIKLQIGGKPTKMLGLAMMTGNNRNNIDPLVRIDYFDHRKASYGVHLHYHLFRESRHRSIWRP